MEKHFGSREERIAAFEEKLDRCAAAAGALEEAVKAFYAAQDDAAELEAYYTGPLWREDLAADEAGELPADLKRGVLSQDAVWDLLERNQKLLACLAGCAAAV